MIATSDRIILPIHPKAYVKVLPDFKRSLNIPDRCHYVPSEQRYRRRGEIVDVRLLGCELWNNTGFCRHTSSLATRRKKKTVFAYNKYRLAVKALCDEVGLSLQESGWSLYFYFPIPERWSKKKKQLLRGQRRISKPDVDNLVKAIFDSLGKRRGDGTDLMPDECVSQLSGCGKFWMYDIEPREGYIEVLLNQPIYNPFNVMMINPLTKTYG